VGRSVASKDRSQVYFQRSETVLVLGRTVNQEIHIGDNIRIAVVSIRGGIVKLGITAPRDVPVYRHEIYEAMKAEESATDSDCD
jgi:carbon storage regulator